MSNNDEIVRAAFQAIHDANPSLTATEVYRGCPDCMTGHLAEAVVAAVEPMIREQIAQEIEFDLAAEVGDPLPITDTTTRFYSFGMGRAALVARGES